MILYDRNNKVVGELYDEYSGNCKKEIYMEDKRIALCIGHNVKSRGAVGSAGISEFLFNRNFLKELLPYLPPTNEYKIFERKPLSSYTAEQNELASQITSWGNCDIAIEFHFNGSDNAEVNGHEILYLSDSGKELAEKLDKQFDKHLNNADRNIKRRDSGNGYGFLSRGAYTSLIVEPFFGAHQHRFIGEGDLVQPLIAAYKEFFSNL